MTAQDENVHALTLDWWGRLPWCYRDADGRQGYKVGPPWHGLNRDPRFVTGWDSWHRTNTSTRPYEASVALSRQFQVETGAPVLVRSWHTPAQLEALTETTSEVGTASVGLMALGETTTTVRVRHTLRNHTGTIVSTTTTELTGDPDQVVDTWWTPDRFGVLHATVEVAVNVPGMMDSLRAVHVGTQEATFEELPDLGDFTVARPYPLLRYMDGVGHQAGAVSDTVEQMHTGGWSDPATAPEVALPYLAALLGLPTDYTDTLTVPRLREHLVDLIGGGVPSAGTSAAIVEVARQWLTGDRQVAVLAGATPGVYPSQAEKDLLGAMAAEGSVIVRDTAPVPPRPSIRWEGATGSSPSVWEVDGERVYENLEPNGGFVTGTTGWAGSSATITRDTTLAHTGDASLKLTPSGYARSVYGAYRYPVDGSAVNMSAHVYTKTGARMVLGVQAEGGEIVYTGWVDVPANQWTELTYRHTPDPGTRYRTWVITTATEPWWLDSVVESRDRYTPDGYFDGDTPEPVPAISRDVWVAPDGVPHRFNTTTWAWDPDTAYTTQGQAVLGTWDSHQFTAAHTLIMLVRADEAPNQDVPAFQTFLNNSGVIPAGHQIIADTASPTWAQWQSYVGDTWATMHQRAPRWVDHHSAGINL